MKKLSTFSVTVFTVVIGAITIKWNPADRFVDSGAPSYYQARVAYERGSGSQREGIREAFADHKLSLHEYSEIVFPAYLKVARSGEALFPEVEKAKSLDQLRSDLSAVISHL